LSTFVRRGDGGDGGHGNASINGCAASNAAQFTADVPGPTDHQQPFACVCAGANYPHVKSGSPKNAGPSGAGDNPHGVTFNGDLLRKDCEVGVPPNFSLVITLWLALHSEMNPRSFLLAISLHVVTGRPAPLKSFACPVQPDSASFDSWQSQNCT
jgi:hypothetical protein